MAEIIEKRRRQYSGLDADKASIPAGGKGVGDSYLATDTKINYFWDGVGWILVPVDGIVTAMIKDLNVTKGKAELGFGRFVSRAVNAPDFDQTDFTTDGNWKTDGLDLSGIVPAGAVAVVLRFAVSDDAANSLFAVRKDAANIYNDFNVYTQVANIEIVEYGLVAINSDRLLDYKGSALAFTKIYVCIMGWYI